MAQSRNDFITCLYLTKALFPNKITFWVDMNFKAGGLCQHTIVPMEMRVQLGKILGYVERIWGWLTMGWAKRVNLYIFMK